MGHRIEDDYDLKDTLGTYATIFVDALLSFIFCQC